MPRHGLKHHISQYRSENLDHTQPEPGGAASGPAMLQPRMRGGVVRVHMPTGLTTEEAQQVILSGSAARPSGAVADLRELQVGRQQALCCTCPSMLQDDAILTRRLACCST